MRAGSTGRSRYCHTRSIQAALVDAGHDVLRHDERLGHLFGTHDAMMKVAEATTRLHNPHGLLMRVAAAREHQWPRGSSPCNVVPLVVPMRTAACHIVPEVRVFCSRKTTEAARSESTRANQAPTTPPQTTTTSQSCGAFDTEAASSEYRAAAARPWKRRSKPQGTIGEGLPRNYSTSPLGPPSTCQGRHRSPCLARGGRAARLCREAPWPPLCPSQPRRGRAQRTRAQ